MRLSTRVDPPLWISYWISSVTTSATDLVGDRLMGNRRHSPPSIPPPLPPPVDEAPVEVKSWTIDPPPITLQTSLPHCQPAAFYSLSLSLSLSWIELDRQVRSALVIIQFCKDSYKKSLAVKKYWEEFRGSLLFPPPCTLYMITVPRWLNDTTLLFVVAVLRRVHRGAASLIFPRLSNCFMINRWLMINQHRLLTLQYPLSTCMWKNGAT